MPDIKQLDAHVAELIAAGEVVERPASVVKELVENAIDAGATAVAVELQRGGMGLIRVTDNGCGIAPDQIATAFLRHATSKLRRAEDLSAIATLGFRGEALAAIAAVSRVDFLSRQSDAEVGASLHLEGGTPGIVEAAGAPTGTTIVVRDLFFNTPARLKFMKKDSAEAAAVLGLMQHLALSHPAVSFQVHKDGAEALHTPGDAKAESAVYAALGREFALGLVPVSGRGGDVAVKGFVTRPLAGRGSRGMQTFFVNGRFVKSQLLTAALEEGYRNQLMKGKFPGCVLQVTLPPDLVDVNVHPAKTQIKFARERDVFDAVYHTVLDTLDAAEAPSAKQTAPVASQIHNPRGDFYQTMDAKSFRESEEKSAAPGANRMLDDAVPSQRPAVAAFSAKPMPRLWDTEWKDRSAVRDSVPDKPAYAPSPVVAAPKAAEAEHAPWPVPAPVVVAEPVQTAHPAVKSGPSREPAPIPSKPAASVEEPQQELTLPQAAVAPAGETAWRMVGEVLHTYILAEDGQEALWLIDKHAAHERLNFDRLRAKSEPPMRQRLLDPAAVELSGEAYGALLEQLALLEEFGFAAEDFGAGCLLVRETPSDIDPDQIRETFEMLAEKLLTGGRADPAAARDAMLHTIACKAAIKGGWTSDPTELQVLVEKVQSGEIRFCPHGRPVAVKFSKYDLEKMFKRA